jgi:hypothetical protein
VEAAGIEPASEIGLDRKTTCLVRLNISITASQTNKLSVTQFD